MLKSEWKFEYTGEKLAAAARLKFDHHDAAVRDWLARKEAVVTTIRAEGLEIEEKLTLKAAITYSTKSRDYVRGGEVMIRNDLQKNLAECYEKLAYHTRRRDTFDGWVQVLEANPHRKLEVQVDDWLFFFGKDVSTGDDEE